jgi:glycosyltransferase involved in cell wall biosynthesis
MNQAIGGPAPHAGAAPLPITVVIAAYNAGHFLAQTLESVARQTAPPAQVVVVDDGSTDGTAEIADRFGVDVIRRPQRGVSAARNEGIRHAAHPWIALLDADDLWLPQKLARQWDALCACPEAGLAFCDFVEFDDLGDKPQTKLALQKNYGRVRRTILEDRSYRCDPADVRAAIIEGQFMPTVTLIVRRDLLDAVGGFDESMRYSEDWELLLRLVCLTTAVVVEEPLVRKRLHAGNVSGNTARIQLSWSQIADRVERNPDRYPPGAVEFFRVQKPRRLTRAGALFLARGEPGEGVRVLWESLRLRFDLLTALRLAAGLLLCVPGATSIIRAFRKS